MALRGFDSYEVSLGDEMRGERASMGKSLRDAQKDMRIKISIIEAIENSDLTGFPNQSVIAGYVRSYARYLGMDSEQCFKKFCAESGYVSPSSLLSGKANLALQTETVASPPNQLSNPLTGSRFASPVLSAGFKPRVSFGAISSSVVLTGLIFGLGYGAFALLQDIQRVGFAPLPQAPSVVADAPLISQPAVEDGLGIRPDPTAYVDGGVLTAIVLPTVTSSLNQPDRDGPISSIDPSVAGVFDENAGQPKVTGSPGAPHDNQFGEVGDAEFSTDSQDRLTVDVPPGTFIIASEDAWVRIRDRDGDVFYEGLLEAGDSFEVPAQLTAPVLRAGNAGGVFILVDGIAYGPVGERGRVVSGVSLKANDVRQLMPEAEIEVVTPSRNPPPEQRAEAGTVRP